MKKILLTVLCSTLILCLISCRKTSTKINGWGKEELIEDVNEEARRIYARCLTYELGVYAKYGEQIEQSLDDSYDNEWLFKLSQLNDDNLESFLQNEVFIYDEE